MRSGFATATGDIILAQDANLEYSPEDYPLLLELITSGKADVVFGPEVQLAAMPNLKEHVIPQGAMQTMLSALIRVTYAQARLPARLMATCRAAFAVFPARAIRCLHPP